MSVVSVTGLLATLRPAPGSPCPCRAGTCCASHPLHGAQTIPPPANSLAQACSIPQQALWFSAEGKKKAAEVLPEARGCRCGPGKAWSRVRERTRSSWVLTSQRSLVLHAGDKERKSHQSLNPHRRHPKHSKPRTWGAVFPFLTQRSHPSSQPQPWGAAGASNVHFHQLQHFSLPNSENEWEWLKAIHCGWDTVCCSLCVPTPLGQAAGTACAPSKQPQGF